MEKRESNRIRAPFYRRSVTTVAKELLGKELIRTINGVTITSRIVETEAYCGLTDRGCHAYKNRCTDRTAVMFHPGGILYIYLIYGLHHCLNIVTGKKGKPQAVLIRAVEPLDQIQLLTKNRNNIKPVKNLTNGPGKLCQALQLDRTLNGHSLLKGQEIYLREPEIMAPFETVTTTRINIDFAGEDKNLPWRFYIKGNSFVSKK